MAMQPSSRSSECGNCEYRTLRMFCNLSPEALQSLDAIGVAETVEKGTVLFHEEDVNQNIAILCSGQVKLSCTSREGKTLILKIAVSGDVLGLSSVISGMPHEVTAEVLETTRVKIVRKEEFLAFLERYGEASLHAARVLSEEYKTAFFDARRLALAPSAAGKLASVLLEWGRNASCGKPVMRFTMSLTHEELANLAGLSRETVTRLLGKFQRQKLIEIQGVSLTVLDPNGLLQLSA